MLEETEEDIEGEKVMADIMNLGEEKLFSKYFTRSVEDNRDIP
jgi:hypothetical protein